MRGYMFFNKTKRVISSHVLVTSSTFILIFINHVSMDLSPFYMKFEKIQNRQKYHHSLKEHAMFSKIAKFGCEML